MRTKEKIDYHKITEELQQRAGTQFFSVLFTKRTTGEPRQMLCRFGVKKHLSTNSEEKPYDPADKGLLSVWDVQKQQYRSIPIDSIKWIRMQGRVIFKKENQK